jgi:23S rRNA (guanosine2251-2'-O)-methyltransferase
MKPLIGTDLKRFLRDYRGSTSLNLTSWACCKVWSTRPNVGSIFRVADGANLTELVLTGITPTPPNPTIDKVGRFKSLRIPWRYEKDPVTAVSQLKQAGYTIVAVELTDTAVPYHTFTYPQKTCLVVGHEDHGVTKATLAGCDAAVFLPMYGKGQSLNVHVAFSIVLYHILHQNEKI